MTTQNLTPIYTDIQYQQTENPDGSINQGNTDVSNFISTVNNIFQSNYFDSLYTCVMLLGSVNMLTGYTLQVMIAFLYGIASPPIAQSGLWDSPSSLWDITKWDSYTALTSNNAYLFITSLLISRKYGVYNTITLKQMLVEFINVYKPSTDPSITYSQIYIQYVGNSIYVSLPNTTATGSIYFWLASYIQIINNNIIFNLY